MENFLYIYVVDRDFGFAPNPFHGYCTLATCKAPMRKQVKIGDWVLGVGGGRLDATGRCVYLMKVTEIVTYDEYWSDLRFQRKKPLRNGSLVMMVGDNIYHKDPIGNFWLQEDSQHSNPDGSPNLDNVRIDTESHHVLLSKHFYYFGSKAPKVDLESIDYQNGRNYAKKKLSDIEIIKFISDIEHKYRNEINTVIGLPFNFNEAAKRVDQASSRII